MNIKEIKVLLSGNPAPQQLEKLECDVRIGVKKLMETYHKRMARLEKERLRYEKMLAFEQAAYAAGAEYIAGVDEAGRGPLAGPLVIAAVILPRGAFFEGLNDSKQLSAAQRERLYAEILSKAVDIRVNIVSVSNIDKENIYRATKRGMAEALRALQVKPQKAFLDAMEVSIEGMECKSITHGDALSVSIAAASVIAKVTRDRLMDKLDKIYPEYGFASNKGYGSPLHMEAIMKYGATVWHRRTYEPVKSMNLPSVAEEENIIYSPQTDAYEYEVHA